MILGASSIGEPERQSPGDLQRLPSATLVQEAQHRPSLSGGEDRDSPEGVPDSVITTRSEGSCLRFNAPRTPSASDTGAEYMQGKSRGRPDTSNIQPPSFAHGPLPVFESPHIITSTEVETRLKVAERQVLINAVKTTIEHLGTPLEVDGREKVVALQPLMEHLYSQIISIQKEIGDRLNVVLSQASESNIRTCEADATSQRAESAFHDLTGGHSTGIETMSTGTSTASLRQRAAYLDLGSSQSDCICNTDCWFVSCNLIREHYNTAMNSPLPLIWLPCTCPPGLPMGAVPKSCPRVANHLLDSVSYI